MKVTTEVTPVDKKKRDGWWSYVVKSGKTVYSFGYRPSEREARHAADADAQTATMFLRPTREGDHTHEQAD